MHACTHCSNFLWSSLSPLLSFLSLSSFSSLSSQFLYTVAPGSPHQVALALLICVSYTCLVLKTAPFEEDSDDVISFVTEVQLTITMFCGFALTMDTTEIPSFNPKAMDIFLVVINCSGFVALILCNLFQKQGDIISVAKTIRKRGQSMRRKSNVGEVKKEVPQEKVIQLVSNNKNELHVTPKKIVPANGESRIQIRPLSKMWSDQKVE